MSEKIPSLDSNFDEVWREMDEIEPLTPLPSVKNEITDEALKAYREAALSDAYMFGEYNGYEAFKGED